MKLMKYLQVFTLLVLAALAVPAEALAGSVTLKVATITPDGTFLVNAMREASDEVKTKTQGRVKFRVYPGGVMGNDTVALRKMRSGQIHGTTLTAHGVSSVSHDFQIMGLPLLFENYEQIDAVTPQIEPVLVKKLEQKGYISFGILEVGLVYMMSNKAVKGPADLKGNKIWIPEGDEISKVVFDTMGIPAVSLPVTDVLTGLQTGLIDTLGSPPVATLILQWFTKIKYLTVQPLLYSYGTFVFSKRAWSKMSPEDQKVVSDVLKKRFTEANAQTRKDHAAALETLRKKGIKFVPLDKGAMKEMKKIANKAISRLMDSGRFDKNLLEKLRGIMKGN